ncbi:uncharacterized protein LOC127745561 [Arachis duranensis]|uniref:Uncharacterized protein LOC127745561 n=1 Tax=Arachis duranensis TaxID=130453 RepID=A0A9C6WRC8_ARADU|nr:uncharacterized protein LOC127745561 [Arachis duranensis]
MRVKVPRNFKSHDMNLYDRTTDPKHHLSNFKSRMYLADASDATRCKAFPTTLSKTAMKWRSENLYGTTWKGSTKRAWKFKTCHRGSYHGLVNGLRDGPFSQSISKRHPTSLSDVQERAEKYFNMEENARLREPSWRQRPPHSAKEKEREPKKKEEVGPDRPRRYHSYTPLKVSLVDVYREICNTERLSPSRPIKNKKGGSRGDYCEYHKMYGHSTNDCYDLKNVIERLAREGRLDRYLMERSDNHGKRKRDDEDKRDPPPQTPERHKHMISGGFAGGGLTKSSRKRHLKRVYQVGNESTDLPTISFTKEDGQGIMLGHDDPVVITMILANANLHRTLVDQGSSADILFKPAFDKLGLDERELKAYPDTLYSWGEELKRFKSEKRKEKNTNIGASLDGDLKQRLIKLLQDNSDLFAWKASDMPGIDPQLMSHKLSVYPRSRPVQQRRRKLRTERAQVVEEQVQALLEADFIQEVKYPAWLANVVLLKK